MVKHRPVIGVIACGRQVEGEPAQAVKHRYLEGVERYADAVPLIIPSNQSEANAAEIVGRLDAILLTGSNSNIEPRRYRSESAGQAPHDTARDGLSDALIHAAINAAKPLFGICRGLQEINVALGGTLRDLRETGDGLAHHSVPDVSLADMFAHSHDVEVLKGSLLDRFSGSALLKVNSVHFQAIDKLAEGLVANAVGPDGVIEAISSSKSAAPIFAVQWHPEWQPEGRAFDLAFWHFLGEAATAQYLPARGSELTT